MIHERLKELQKTLRLNIKEFADKCGLPYSTVQSYLLNTRSPTLQNLSKIAQTFDVNLNWLIKGEGSMFVSSKIMPESFVERVKNDLEKQPDIINSLSFKDKIDDFMDGKASLNRIEVIELARKLNQPLEEYLSLADYILDIFDRALQNSKVIGMLRSFESLSDEEIDEVMDTLSLVLEGYIAKKQKEKEQKNGE